MFFLFCFMGNFIKHSGIIFRQHCHHLIPLRYIPARASYLTFSTQEQNKKLKTCKMYIGSTIIK